MKLCDLTQFYSPLSGGVKRYVHEKINYIQTDCPDDEHVLIIPDAATGVAEGKQSRIYSIHSPLISRTSRYRALINLRAIEHVFERERPDIIEVGDPYQTAWKAIASGRALRIPVVGFYHSHFPEAYLRSSSKFLGQTASEAVMDFARRYVRNLYNHFGATLVPSHELARVLVDWGVRNVHAVDLGVNTDVFRPDVADRSAMRHSLGIADDQKLLLYVGRLAVEKNVQTLFDAFAELTRRSRDRFHLLVIGDGPQRDGVRRLQETAANVTWRSYCQDSAELARYYRAADLFVHPGVQETFGLVALESQACGTPVVGIAGSYMDRIIFHDQGWWARENSPTALADAIQEVASQRLETMSESASHAAAKAHAWPRVFERLFCIYRTCALTTTVPDAMETEKAFTIRNYRASDREAVRRLCCETGFLGEAIDPVYEDRELFADFLTTYYTDHEPESSFVVEVNGELRGYLLGCRRPLLNQLYSFYQNICLSARALLRFGRYNETSRRFIRWIVMNGWREVPAAPRRTPHFHINLLPDARKIATTRALIQRLLQLPLSAWREARLRADRHLRKPPRRENV